MGDILAVRFDEKDVEVGDRPIERERQLEMETDDIFLTWCVIWIKN